MGWNPFKAKREHELKLAQLAADNQRFMVEALAKLGSQQASSLEKVGEMVATISTAQLKSAEVLQTWLEGFKVMEPPVSSTVRDEDEARDAVLRTLATDDPFLPQMPSGLAPELQLAWQLKQTFPD